MQNSAFKRLGSKVNLLLALSVALFGFGILMPALSQAATGPLNVWWPTNGAHISGTQPFKAQLSGLDVSQYQMFWQVDGGALNPMSDNQTDYPHKEASVDVSGWSWHGSGPYAVDFIAKDQSGNIVAQQTENIYVDNGLPMQTSTQTAPAQTETSTQTSSQTSGAATTLIVQNSKDPGKQVSVDVSSLGANSVSDLTLTLQDGSSNATQSAQSQTETQSNFSVKISAPTVSLSTSGLYVNPNSEAASQALTWASDTTNAAAMQLLAAQPTATWFGDWNSNVQSDVHTLVSAAAQKGQTPVLVSYNIPERDCGGFSQGGSNNPAGYNTWISQFAQGLGQSNAIVILEPDALAQMSCLSQADQQTRLNLLFGAVHTLKQDDSNAKVYLDAGHSGWVNPGTMAGLLHQAGLAMANGFSLNVSNFDGTASEVTYGQQVSQFTGGAHFVVDTSRNGNGSSNGDWCNPSGMAVGQTPTLQTGNPLVDAFLWVKTPGESDGSCNGGPSAGTWWPNYALSLVLNAH